MIHSTFKENSYTVQFINQQPTLALNIEPNMAIYPKQNEIIPVSIITSPCDDGWDLVEVAPQSGPFNTACHTANTPVGGYQLLITKPDDSRVARQAPHRNSSVDCPTSRVTDTLQYNNSIQKNPSPKRAGVYKGRDRSSIKTVPLQAMNQNSANDVKNLNGQVTKTTRHPLIEGNYSSVYKGTWQDKQVAIKSLRAIRKTESSLRKYHRELIAWSHLDHQNVLTLFGSIQDDQFGHFGAVVTPWCEYGNARDFLAQPRTIQQKFRLFYDVALGLRYLHKVNPTIVHGDLKPSNVLVDSNFTAKIYDFGLVNFIHDQPDAVMTTIADSASTTRYLAYELVSSDDEQLPTTASDVYALGCIGLEFIYSTVPYANIRDKAPRASFKICREINKGKPPATRPADLKANLSKLWDVFESCWDHEPAKRPTADDICIFLDMNIGQVIDSFRHS